MNTKRLGGKLKFWGSGMWLVTFLCACVASPTRAFTPTTPTVVPTVTTQFIPTVSIATPQRTLVELLPTAFISPTPILNSPLKTDGPYFIYLKETGVGLEIVVMDQDGQGRRVFQLPTDASYPSLDRAISPDGKWLVFHTGWAGMAGVPVNEQTPPFNLTLQLLDLTTGETHIVSPLLSREFPRNFQETAQEVQNQIDAKNLPDPANLPQYLYFTFMAGIQAYSWSPDGRQLAFAGQMDGPSSDLYIYDLSTQKITRLSDGPLEIVHINWSLTDNVIDYASTYLIGEGDCANRYTFSFADFSTEDHGEICGVGNGDPAISVNIAGWPGKTVYRIATDKKNGLTLLASDEEDGNSLNGLYLVNQNTQTYQLVKPNGYWDYVQVWEAGEYRFIASGDDFNRIIGVEADGTWDQISNKVLSPHPSPDKQWLALSGEDLNIYNIDGQLTKHIAGIKIFNLTWSPDSRFILFSNESGIYSLEMNRDEPVRLALDNFNDTTPLPHVWFNWAPDGQGVFIEVDDFLYYAFIPIVQPAQLLETNFSYGTWSK